MAYSVPLRLDVSPDGHILLTDPDADRPWHGMAAMLGLPLADGPGPWPLCGADTSADEVPCHGCREQLDTLLAYSPASTDVVLNGSHCTTVATAEQWTVDLLTAIGEGRDQSNAAEHPDDAREERCDTTSSSPSGV